jgi:hypothetical protein
LRKPWFAASIALAQTLDHELRQPRQLIARSACREHQADRLCVQAARDERERLLRRAIEPLPVIHQADQRLLLGHSRQQGQDRQADEEAIRSRTRADPEGRQQCIALRDREALDPVQHRRQQLMQSGEGKLHLRLDTHGTGDKAARHLLDHVLQQRRLAHAPNRRPNADWPLAGYGS